MLGAQLALPELVSESFIKAAFRIRALSERLSTSLWLWPASAIAVAIALGFGLPHLETPSRGWLTFDGKAESARELLSTIASCMLTITGVVFSITILVLQLASSQFSPRILRTFLRDRTTQLTMSIFLGSFVYALVVLVQVRSEEGERAQFVPGFSIYVGFVLAIAAVLMLVRYIHHMAHAIRPAYVLERIAEETHDVIENTFPHEGAGIDSPNFLPQAKPPQVVTNVEQAGVLTAVDLDELLDLTARADATVVIEPMIGQFVPHGAVLMRVWGTQIDPSTLRACMILEAERTPQQDPSFGLRQLTDVAERALSPGTNDPTTAVQALDRVHDLLRCLAQRELGSLLLRDQTNEVRVVLARPDWPTFVQAALDEVRQYGSGSTQVMGKLRYMLLDLKEVAPLSRRAVLSQQLRLLEETRAPRNVI